MYVFFNKSDELLESYGKIWKKAATVSKEDLIMNH